MQICWKFYFWLVYNFSKITFLWLFVLVGSLFLRWLAVFITLAQNLLDRLLLISIESFIVTLVHHPHLANLFSLCTYGAVYHITIFHFLQQDQSLININSPSPSALSIFIKHPDSASMCGSQVGKTSTKSFLLLKYKVQVFRVCVHIKIVAYTLLN